MREPQPKAIQLKDYAPPAFLIDAVELDVDIRADDAVVRAKLAVRRNPRGNRAVTSLVLDGDELELLSVSLDGNELKNGFSATAEKLAIDSVPDAFALETVSRIVPQKNTKLEGLYATKQGFVTQCEAEGFRRITWYLDRPDVMARFTTTVRADPQKYPVLLSNGNLVDSGKGWARFEDPFPKPSYLFALVAADLEALEGEFLSRSGKKKQLAIYVEPGKLPQAGWAMDCLKRAIAWDEKRFGLELDLEQYKIVAVGDFNSGAMENKGLNIFNTKYVLASAATATDADYLNIDRVVAHEYFHNWTGDRVTCRDWFQLSLKEGLTVFRDQEYGADTYSRAVTRIQEVRGLRAAQFPEDAGPMKHPVRPQSYMEIRNFYTMTVYEKGAEVVRMQHTLLGEEKFQAGMRLYFERHDGQAATCDEFVQAMQDASGVDLSQFRRWYDIAGTPVLDVQGAFSGSTFTLTVNQSMNPPFHVPFAVKVGSEERVLSVRNSQERFSFENLDAKPIPSLLRGFSAPVILDYPYTEDELLHLMARDDDPFNRWEAAQRLLAIAILEKDGVPSPKLVGAAASILGDRDHAFAAEVLALPAESFLAEQLQVVDPERLHEARNRLRRKLAFSLKDEFLRLRGALQTEGPYSPDPASMGRRALKNLCLGFLSEIGMSALCYEQFRAADNMTDTMAALGCLANSDCPERAPALAAFYERWQHEPLVIDKWLGVQATSRLKETLPRVRELLRHPAFDIKVPNKVYALIRGFSANHARFHAADGAGYAFLADQVIALNALNPGRRAHGARLRSLDEVRRREEGPGEGGTRAPARPPGPVQGRHGNRRQDARMTGLIAATALFIVTHFVPSTPLRPALVRAIGEGPYRGLYSLVALAGIAWMCIAYSRAPLEPLWAPLRELPLVVMPFAFVLLACGYWRNPTMVGADRLLKADDPARGMIRITRHPLMWAIMLWSAAHLLARGDLKSLVFFGGLFLLAALGTVLMDRRKKSNPDWARFAAVTSNIPFVAIAQGRNRIVWREIGWLRPLAGLIAFAAFFAAHSYLFGARPY